MESRQAGAKSGGNARTKGASATRKATPAQRGNGRSLRPLYIGIAVAVIAVIAVLAYYSLSSPTTFQEFKQNFNSAKEVAIYVNDTNPSTYQYAVGCAGAVIQQLVGPTSAHRDPSTVHFFIIYNSSTECVYNPGTIGEVNSTYTTTSASNCLNFSRSMPSMFFEYSAVNSTLITPTRLYVNGDERFMGMCGLAYQMT